MKRIFFLIFLIGIPQIFALAQSPSNCPTISVTGSTSMPVEPNGNLTFTANVSKEYDTSNLKYIWTVFKGKIVSGQGTLILVVAAKDISEIITATLTVEGLPAQCPNTASESFSCPDCGFVRRVILANEYKKLSKNEEKLNLNRFADQLKVYPAATAFITKSFTRNVSKITAYRDLQRILSYLQTRGITKNLITFGATYDKEEQTSLFIVPPGAELPKFDDEILNVARLAAKLKTNQSIKEKIKRKKNFR